MVGSVERNRIFYDRVVELMLDSELNLNATDVVRVLTAILVRLSMREAPPEDREALRAQIYNRLIDHEESVKQGQEPPLYSASDITPRCGRHALMLIVHAFSIVPSPSQRQAERRTSGFL